MKSSHRRTFLNAVALSALLGASARSGTRAAQRRTLRANPGDYRRVIGLLQPGDRLELAPGEYLRGLPLHGLAATAAWPIVINGPAKPARAVFVARRGAHTVSLLDSAHIVIRDLVLDGRGVPVDAVRAEGHARWAHHITLEGLTIVNHGAGQQNSGISTKCPAWGWTVRGCTISGAGTGMYFGDSDGSDPFFDSLIEGNRIVDPVGYGIQIKHQFDRPAEAGAADAARTTVIRRNTIIKSRPATAPEAARPNLLVGHWPLEGSGMRDRYLIHGNLLFDNPSEALFQGEGNIALYNNLLFNPRGDGVRIRPHNHKPREIALFHNTIVAAGLGVGINGAEEGHERLFAHNLVYGSPAVQSEIDGENHTGDFERARMELADLSPDPARFDLAPRRHVPGPQSTLDSRWLDLPGARDDRLGRPRSAPVFGACLSDPAASACR